MKPLPKPTIQLPSEAKNPRADHKSLRDEFAGQALMGLVAFSRNDTEDNRPEHFARWSYALADAMLAYRHQETTT
ncbi:hypothetical protein [Neorhizobium sp. JUb45]|uniref:hypothetical protein n=1 Tax=Neorhizobium sp. JUb45 TaxID=2485113 RepID=UPI0010529F3D|nr:hypothetical protein [Neorhizobium sp. JUb45]TCR07293.1 hypothetical protein EDF70_1011266 [Neorhizobium sp. JUb45]